MRKQKTEHWKCQKASAIPTETLEGDESRSPPEDLLFGIPVCIIACFGNSVVLQPLLQNRFELSSVPLHATGFSWNCLPSSSHECVLGL